MFAERGSGNRESIQDTIFISYRRSDTEGYAGRLEDALKAYFGQDRVFRDVGGITAGEDFEEKIEQTMESAGALIVLIGPDWLVSRDGTQPRLHEPGDHVAGEIKAALGKKRVIVPVLVEGVNMPREEDLPDTLKELSRRNAVSISDAGWSDDTNRLAKVLAIDVSGSVAEQKLERLKLVVVSLLVVSMMVTFGFFASGEVLDLSIRSADQEPVYWVQFIGLLNPLFAILAGSIAMWKEAWLDQASSRFIRAAAILGALGLFFTMIYYLADGPFPSGDEYRAFLATSSISTLMLGLFALSGFRPNDNVR